MSVRPKVCQQVGIQGDDICHRHEGGQPGNDLRFHRCPVLFEFKNLFHNFQLGLNSFFAVVVANIVNITGLTYLESFQAALCIILVEGVVFIILSVLNVREKVPFSFSLKIFCSILFPSS